MLFSDINAWKRNIAHVHTIHKSEKGGLAGWLKWEFECETAQVPPGTNYGNNGVVEGGQQNCCFEVCGVNILNTPELLLRTSVGLKYFHLCS